MREQELTHPVQLESLHKAGPLKTLSVSEGLLLATQLKGIAVS